jgi:hypothetical protein
MAFGPGCSITLDGFAVLAVSPSGWSLVLEKKEGAAVAGIARDEWVFAVSAARDEALIWRDDQGDLRSIGHWPIPKSMEGHWS